MNKKKPEKQILRLIKNEELIHLKNGAYLINEKICVNVHLGKQIENEDLRCN